jgi:hypothetical protein
VAYGDSGRSLCGEQRRLDAVVLGAREEEGARGVAWRLRYTPVKPTE